MRGCAPGTRRQPGSRRRPNEANTIRATATTVNGSPNVDYLEVQR
jgi:hypothetical protein